MSPLDALRRLKKFFWFLFAVALFPALFAPGPELSNPLGGTLPVSAEGLEAWRETFRICQASEIWQVHGDWIRQTTPAFGPGRK